jgi:hypothetical protein
LGVSIQLGKKQFASRKKIGVNALSSPRNKEARVASMKAPIEIHSESAMSTNHPFVAGSVSREKVYARTTELAILAGRQAHEISKYDYDRAKQELTGSSDPDQQLLLLY